MPEIVAKVIYEDGTEESFGPMPAAEDAAEAVIGVLAPLREAQAAKREEQTQAAAEEEVRRRNEQADRANRLYAEAGQRGVPVANAADFKGEVK